MNPELNSVNDSFMGNKYGSNGGKPSEKCLWNIGEMPGKISKKFFRICLGMKENVAENCPQIFCEHGNIKVYL